MATIGGFGSGHAANEGSDGGPRAWLGTHSDYRQSTLTSLEEKTRLLAKASGRTYYCPLAKGAEPWDATARTSLPTSNSTNDLQNHNQEIFKKSNKYIILIITFCCHISF